MTIYKNFDDIQGSYTACIGFFDGVHRGHGFLLEHLKQEAAATSTQAAVITFANHPKALLHPEQPLLLIDSFDEKMSHLAATGIDACFVLDFTPAVRDLSAHDFICEVLVRRLHITTLLIGYDHRFGHNRSEGFDDYVRYGRECGIRILHEPVFDDGTGLHYSSSEVRQALLAGNVARAAALLGRFYTLSGTVVGGHRLGRQIGFPTANLQPADAQKIVPANGVYAAIATLADGSDHAAMLNIGQRPTVGDDTKQITLEANIIDFEGNLYNQSLQLAFVARMRDEQKLPSLAALQEQLRRDRAEALRLVQTAAGDVNLV